jgi:alcohol dehydrogenase
MLPFDFHCPTRIVFGAGKVDELGPIASALGAKRVIMVSDPGIVSVGHTQRGIDSLQRFGLTVMLFDGVGENPTTDHVEAGLAVARDFKPDHIVGLGGGSSMDCAKGINFLYSCGGRMQDYWGEGKATGPLLPMIAVPTTAGTGSETQSYALIADARTHVKMACGDKRAAFRVAILDPTLTVTQPQRVTALTGIDAIAHAIETYVTKRRSAISLAFSREAWRHLAPNFSRVLDEPENLAARAEMQLGACLAGLAIENSMLGAAHALANPLTAAYGIVHGEAIALMLPRVIRHNGRRVADWYHELLISNGETGHVTAAAQAPDALADFVAANSRRAGLASTLTECGVAREKLPELAAAAAKQWTGKFNPVELSEHDFQQLYETALC